MVILGAGPLIFKESKLLLILRKAETFNGVWANPGGTAKADEPLATTAARETLEEVGLTVTIGPFISDYIDRRDGKHIGTYRGFLATSFIGEPQIREPDKILDLRYFDMKNLPENLAPFTRHYLEIGHLKGLF